MIRIVTRTQHSDPTDRGPSLGNDCSTDVTDAKARSGVLFRAILVTLTVACVVPVWTCDYFPTQNGPSLLYIAFVQGNLDNPAYGYSAFFDWHPFPTPYLLQTSVLNLLFLVVSPLVADKIWISCVIVLRPWALLYFLRRLGPGRDIYTLASLPLLYDFSLMRGYFNYHAGVSIGLIVFGYYLSHRNEWTRRSIIVFNLLVLLHYFTHPVALAVTGVLLAAYEFATSRSPARIMEIVLRGYVPSIILLSAFLVWSSLYGAWVDPHIEFLTLSDKIQNVHFRGATPLSTAANVMSLGLLAAVACIGCVLLAKRYGEFGIRKMYINPRIIVKEPMLTALAAATALYILMPWDLIGWHKADVRVIPFIFMLILAVTPALKQRWSRVAFIATASLVVVASLPLVSSGLREGSREIAEYMAGLEAVPPRSKILSVFHHPRRSEDWKLGYAVEPLQRADCYYALLKGGATRNNLAKNNTLYWVWYKDYRSLSNFPTVDEENPTSEQFAVAADTYDAVLLWNGLSELRGQFARRGFRTAFEQGRLTVLTKTGRHDKPARVSAR